MGQNSLFGPHEHEDVHGAGSDGFVHTPCAREHRPGTSRARPSCPVSVLRSLGSREAQNAKSCSTEGF